MCTFYGTPAFTRKTQDIQDKRVDKDLELAQFTQLIITKPLSEDAY